MIEIGLGVLAVLGAIVVLAGAGDTLGLPVVDLFPLLGYGGTGFVLAVGVLLIAAGLSRRAMQRHHARRYALRTARLTWGAGIAIACLAIGLPLSVEPFNLLHVAGFPLGYYLASQGALIAVVAVAFEWARRQNAVDAEHRREGNAEHRQQSDAEHRPQNDPEQQIERSLSGAART